MIPSYTKDGKTYALKSLQDLGLSDSVGCRGCAFDAEGCFEAPSCYQPFEGQWREVGQPWEQREVERINMRPKNNPLPTIQVDSGGTAHLHKPAHGGYPATFNMAEHKAAYRSGHAPDAAYARLTDPETSHEAAAEVGGGKLQDLVLLKLQEKNEQLHDGTEPVIAKGMTGKELATALGRPLNSITPRFAQLRRKGLIHPVGKRDKQIVWRVGNGVGL